MTPPLLDRLRTMYSHRGDGMPTQFVNPDGLEAAAEIERLTAERDQLREVIADPNAVHINMLRGTIGKPTIEQMLHVHGEAAVARWNSVPTLTAERDAAEEGARAWQEAVEGLEAHLQDRVAMNDQAKPTTYLEIVRGYIAGVPKSAKQLLKGRYSQYASVAAERDAAVARAGAAATDERARIVALERAIKELLQYEGHHAYCGHGEDMEQPCVCGLIDKQTLALAALESGAAK